MNYLPLKIWLIVTVTLALGALVVRLAWEITFITATSSLVIVILVIFATISIYAFFIYLTIKPGLKKLKRRPVAIWATVMATVALTIAIIHFVRFVPSPEAALFLSLVIATLLLTAGISAYLLILWVIWFRGKD
jgi:hypothetical protein